MATEINDNFDSGQNKSKEYIHSIDNVSDARLPELSIKKITQRISIWFIAGVITAAILIAVVIFTYWIWRYLRQPQSQVQQPVQNINEILDKATNLPQIEIPSANPLEKIAPEKNPIEITNPFDDTYQNPF